MKIRTILYVFLFACSLAQGAALDMRFQQRNATDTGDVNRLVPFPGGGANGLFSGTQEIMRATNGNTNALIVALGNVSTTTLTVTGTVPAGLYAKLRTQNNTSTPTFTAMPGQEVIE